ncbi:CTP synthase [Candidatus Jorgensenbacteria bacterium]|nr:CTP synthase [Candidatus Jorgensenbacteria bacterium]
MKNNLKFVFVTGGTVSGIGKGVSAAALGTLLNAHGLKILPIKIDPYLNKDAGTMNPYQHGEVFVTDDGAETDLDLGHYERFMGTSLDRFSNFTTGAVYERVIHQERHGDFLGETIQIIPHVTDEIKSRIIGPAKTKRADVVVVEIGGTVGDIEAEPYLEAARQILREYGYGRVAFVHVVKIDYLFPSGEAKTKPIQQSVTLLRARGIQPDFLIVRCKDMLGKDIREKLSLFTTVPRDHIIEARDVSFIYEVPLDFRRFRVDELLLERLDLPLKKGNMRLWQERLRKMKRARRKVTIALVGKYVENVDAYLSVEEAIRVAAAGLGASVNIVHVDAESKSSVSFLKGVAGIIVPGGFGRRGIEGKIEAIRVARENKIPYLGLCLGLQTAVIEFARNVAKLKGAHSTEFDSKTKHPVIMLMPEQERVKMFGGTMRLGSSGISLKKDTIVSKLYGETQVFERHRHRYEVNPKYHQILERHGMVFSGFTTKDKRLVEFIELPKHPFFVSTQAHPEFKSRFLEPHPLFVGFIKAVLKRK